MMLEGAGFEVVDLGVDVPQSAFADAIDIHSPRTIALSCLLTTTLPMMPATVTPLAATGVRDQITRRAPISAAAVGEHLPQQERKPVV